jgi:hydrogenase expression/formation protein HypE
LIPYERKLIGMVKHSLSFGKINPNMLKEIVFSCLGSSDPRVIVGPRIGEDAAVIDFKEKVLIVHSDPITGTIENIGWLAVNVCANDIATRGVRPLWILTVILLPKNFDSTQLKKIASQIDEAARKLHIAVIGGHSEVTSSVTRPVIVATIIGEAKKGKFVTSSGAKVGDSLIVTKGAAIEGTAILSTEMAKILEKKVDKNLIINGQKFIKITSIVKDALIAIKIGGVHAMHDATEGGIAGGLQEIAWASNTGIMAYEEKIPIYKETQAICKALQIDPLKTISSGTLIISAHKEKAEKIVSTLKKNNIQASIIGEVVEKTQGSFIIRRDRTRLNLSRPVKEELWKILGNR